MAAAESCHDSPSTVILTSGGTSNQSLGSCLQDQCSMSASCPCIMASRSVGFSLDVQPGRRYTELLWSFTLSEPLCTSYCSCTLIGNLLPPGQSLTQVSPCTYCTEAPKSPPLSRKTVFKLRVVYRGRAWGGGEVRPPRATKYLEWKNWFYA